MEKALVSILVPVFNVESYIDRCLHSLFGQTFKFIQYVFVDDCTPDRSIEILRTILEQYPERKPFVEIVRHDVNRGLTAARKTALAHAIGEYVWHVDSDDYIALDAVEKLYAKASSEHADMVVFDATEVYRGDKRKLIKNEMPFDKEKYLELLLLRQRRYELCFRFCSRKLYENIELDTQIGFGEDYATTPRLVYMANKVVKLNLPCYYYIKYNQNSYTKSVSVKAVRSIERGMRLLERFFSNKSDKYGGFLTMSKMYLKVHMLKGTVYDAESFLYANNLFPELQKSSCHIRLKDNILLWMSKYRCYASLRIYIKVGLFFRK